VAILHISFAKPVCIQEFKRKLILESAFEFFSDQGFDEVAMDDIAENAEFLYPN
jgi:AcrR family transcriptional regulator